jgi:peptidylprolyl isomerase
MRLPPIAFACLLAVAACKKSSHNPPAPARAPDATKGPLPMSSPPDPSAPADVKAPPADAEKTASGLASRRLAPGTGTTRPGPTDTVTVHYTGWMTDGRKFDSSVDRGQPARFPLNGVIKGWTEGVQLMVEGEKRRFWIPAGLAYGDTPRRPGGPHGMLVFDVELLAIVRPPAVPDDVAAAPSTAKKTASGLAYRVLAPGTGTQHPKSSSVVEVHYTGWTTDGKLFDSSVTRGAPASFPLDGVIAGWTEGLQLMVVGEKTRFWIPGALAYGETPSRPGVPAGTLVFDVELLAIR